MMQFQMYLDFSESSKLDIVITMNQKLDFFLEIGIDILLTLLGVKMVNKFKV